MANTAQAVVHRLHPLIQRRSLYVGLLQAIGRTLSLSGVTLLVLASYAWWGSPESPLRYALWPGVVLLTASIIVHFTLRRIVPALQRLLRHQLRAVERFVAKGKGRR
jgi:FtsH-binding integral membrane protein